MSCVVAIRDRRGWCFATETNQNRGNFKVRTERKIFTHRGLLIGCTGIPSGQYVIRAVIDDLLDDEQRVPHGGFRVSQLRTALIAKLRVEGWKPEEHDGAPVTFDLSLLISDGLRLVEIYCCNHFDFVEGDFGVIGCGEIEARSAFQSMRKLRPRASAKAYAEHCIDIVKQIDVHCGGDTLTLIARRTDRRMLYDR